MTTAEILEAGMLLCFTAGWYWSILTMLRSKEPRGKATPFVLLTALGYMLGLSAKLWSWQSGDTLSHTALIYASNLSIVLVDLILVIHLSRVVRRREGGEVSTALTSFSGRGV